MWRVWATQVVLSYLRGARWGWGVRGQSRSKWSPRSEPAAAPGRRPGGLCPASSHPSSLLARSCQPAMGHVNNVCDFNMFLWRRITERLVSLMTTDLRLHKPAALPATAITGLEDVGWVDSDPVVGVVQCGKVIPGAAKMSRKKSPGCKIWIDLKCLYN